MRRKFLTAVFIFANFIVLAQAQADRQDGFDYSATAGVRSVPLGAAVTADGGYNQLLWGQPKESVLYGFVRPGVALWSAGTINGFDATLQIKPISFIGFNIGRSGSYRIADSSLSADCSRYQCDGSLKYDYGSADFVVGNESGLFLRSTFEIRDVESSASSEPFYEDALALIGALGGDRIFTQTHTLGKKVENYIVAIDGRRSEAHRSGSYSQRVSLGLTHSIGPWRFLYAAGAYESQIQKIAPTLGIEIRWTGREGLSLF